MHRMRHVVVLSGLVLAALIALSGRASADLIESNPAQTYPDLFGGNTNGRLTYTYDPAAGTGKFTSVNLPTYIATAPTTADGQPGELSVVPTLDGIRRQVINLTVDQKGKLVTSANNTYELYGTVVVPSESTNPNTVGTESAAAVGSQTFSGLLLKGTPTAFGSMAIPGSGLSTFDMKMNITGGELAKLFGSDAYVEITPKVGSTFTGSFAGNFEGSKVTSNTRGSFAPPPPPLPVPEPTTLVMVLAGGAGMVFRHRRRLKG